MGKSLGSSSTATQEMPQWLEEAARRNLNQADRISRIGYVPQSYGPTVAAFTPMQNAAFANTVNTANAFGLAAPTGADVYGGMPAPTDYGNGVLAYSAKPIYDNMVDEFRADRPAQASYIDSFFIDPITGTPGTFAGNVSDIGFTDNPMVSGASNSGGGTGGSTGTATLEGNDIASYLDPNNRMGMADHMARQQMNYAKAAQDAGDNILSYGQDADGGVYAIGYSGNTISPAKADEMGVRVRDENPFDMSIGEHMSAMAGDVKDIASTIPTPMNVLANTSPAGEDLPGNAVSRTLNIGAGKKDSSSDSGYAGKADDGCVIATHAISTGAYNYKVRREAEIWCMRKLHNKWWGETIRRGYRYLGRQKIEQGKASEHYDEFKQYIAFATGKKRDLKGALTFTLRSIQFFAVGLFARNS